MSRTLRLGSTGVITAALTALVVLAPGAVSAPLGPSRADVNVTLTVQVVGKGTVTSSPAGISCPSQCTASFPQGTTVTLTESPGPQPPSPLSAWLFHGWEGACFSLTTTCAVKLNAATTIRVPFVGVDVNRAVFNVKWSRSVPKGAFVLTYFVSNPSTLTGTLTSSGGQVRTFDLSHSGGGNFTYTFAIPKTNFFPGTYALKVTGTASGPRFPVSIETKAVMAPPKEGVVAKAWISAFGGSAPVARLPASAIGATAHFVFAATANPIKGSAVTATWFRNNKKFFGPVGKPRTKNVTSFVGVRGGHLPRGFYTCVLKARGLVVKQVGIQVG